MHHHGTAAWMLLICAAFLGCAAASFSRSSIFFFAPFFDPHRHNSTTPTPPIIQCGEASNSTLSSDSESYLVCAFMLSNLSTGLMYFVGALVVGFGGVVATSSSGTSEGSSLAEATGDDAASSGGGTVNTEQQQQQQHGSSSILPGHRYFRLFLLSAMASCMCGGVVGLTSVPSVAGDDANGSTAKATIGIFFLGACCCGTAMLALLAGISVRWPNIYDVLFCDEPRGMHGIKPRKVDRSAANSNSSPLLTGRAANRASSSLESEQRDALDYLHLALMSPPSLVLVAYIIGWCVSCFFADITLSGIEANDSRSRSAVFGFTLLCSTSALSCIFARASDCFAIDSFEEGGAGGFDDAASMNTARQQNAAGRPPLAPPSVRSGTTSVHSAHQDGVGWSEGDFTPGFFRSSFKLVGVALAEVMVTPAEEKDNTNDDEDQAGGLYQGVDEEQHAENPNNNSDASSSSRKRSGSSGGGASSSSSSCCASFRFQPEHDMPRRLVLRISRSLRLLGTYVLFVVWPFCLASLMSAQSRVIAFFLTSQSHSVSSRIYNRHGSLNIEPAMCLVWWLVLYLLTQAVFARGGFIKYLSFGFVWLVLAAACNFILQSVSEETVGANPGKSFTVELAVILPVALLAAAQLQLFVFTLSLAFCVLPRPMFPVAMCTLYLFWSIGDFSAARSPGSSVQTGGYMFLSAVLTCSILALGKFLLILKLKAAFEHPRALFAKIRDEASEDGGGGGGADDATLRRDRGSTLSQKAVNMFSVLPPHRLLHWDPRAIDAAFSIFESTESMYQQKDRGAAAGSPVVVVPGGGSGPRQSSGTPTGSYGAMGSGLDAQQQRGASLLAEGGGSTPQAPPLGGAAPTTPRRPKKSSDLKYYAMRR